MRIKSRKDREKEYAEIYGDISLDQYKRLEDKLGNKLNKDTIDLAVSRIKEANEKLTYNSMRFTFYEIPIQAHRPRANFKRQGMHVPNAKANFDAMEKFLKEVKDDIKIICLPMKINLTAYLPMPANLNPVDTIIYETENDYGIGKPDFDNILKAYTDMIQKHLIMDDDLVVSCTFNKYYSLKPRVVMDIIFPNGCISDHTYKTITSRKTYKDLGNSVNVRLLTSPYKSTKSRR